MQSSSWLKALCAVAIFIALLAGRVDALALNPDVPITKYHHTAWTAKDGLPGAVPFIGQDADGYLWILSLDGVYRFDGVEFESIFAIGGDSLKDVSFTALTVGPSGDVLVGSAGKGIARITKGGVVRRIGLAGERGAIFEMTESIDGTIWCNSSGRLLMVRGTRITKVGRDWNYPAEGVQSVLFDSKGTLWSTSLKGRLVYLTRGSSAFEYADKNVVAESLIASKDGRVVVTGDDGIFLIAEHGVALKKALKIDGQPSGLGSIDRDGNLWVSQHTGLRRFRLGRDTAGGGASRISSDGMSMSEGLSSNTTNASFEDRAGNVWVGTSRGLDRFRDVKIIDVGLKAPTEFAFSIAKGSGHAIWASAWDGLLYKIDGKDVSKIDVKGLDNVRTLYADPAGSLWIGGKSYLWRMHDGSKPERMIVPEATRGDLIRSMTMGQDGRLWIGTADTTPTATLMDGQWGTPDRSTGFPSEWSARAAFTDSKGVLWFGGSDLVVRVSDGKSQKLTPSNSGLDVGFILTFAQGAGRLWVGGTKGIAFFDGKRFHSMYTADGQSFGSVSGIAETERGDLWLNLPLETLRIRAPALQSALLEPVPRLHPERLNIEDGRKGGVTAIVGRPSLLEGGDGKIWIATDTGVGWVDPKSMDSQTQMPATFIRDITVDGRRIDMASPVRLPALGQHIEIRYQAAELAIPERILFRYRVDGFDSNWQDAGTRRVAFYNSLPPGHYRFSVTSTNERGDWNADAVSLAFEVVPAWYQAIWFRVLCAFGLLTLAWLTYRFRIGQLAQRLALQLQTQILERERIARELHDTLLQSFYGLLMQFYSFAENMPVDDPKRHHLTQVLEQADVALLEGRESVHNLRGLAQDGLKLAEMAALARLEINGHTTTDLQMSTIGEERALHPVVIEQLNGLLREALRNAYRHAGADNIRVQITYGPKVLRLVVEDDGRGIAAETLERGRSKHWGMLGMRERAERIGGRLDITSKLGRGTRIELKLRAAVAYKRPGRLASSISAIKDRFRVQPAA